MERFDSLRRAMGDAIGDLNILSGDIVDDAADAPAGWQDVAATAAINLRTLADMLDSIRRGETHFRGSPWRGSVVFPCIGEFCTRQHDD